MEQTATTIIFSSTLFCYTTAERHFGHSGHRRGLVFAKDGSIRQKPASNKAKYLTLASMARTRENTAEFGQAAKYSKVPRDSLRVAIASASDSRLASRLTKLMCEVI